MTLSIFHLRIQNHWVRTVVLFWCIFFLFYLCFSGFIVLISQNVYFIITHTVSIHVWVYSTGTSLGQPRSPRLSLAFWLSWHGWAASSLLLWSPDLCPTPVPNLPGCCPINQSRVWMLSLRYQACSLETASLGRLIFSSPLLWSPPRCHTIACGEQDVFLSSFLSFPLYRHLRSKVTRKRRILWRPLPDSTLSFKMDIQVFKTHYLKKYIF